MTHTEIIRKTVRILEKLPKEKAEEISDYADFLFMKYEENLINEGIHKIVSHSKTYDFLNDDSEVTYTVNDIRTKYGEG